MPDLLDCWTRDQVLDLPDDGNRYELVDGVLLVTPSPRALHQIAVWALKRVGVAEYWIVDLDAQLVESGRTSASNRGNPRSESRSGSLAIQPRVPNPARTAASRVSSARSVCPSSA